MDRKLFGRKLLAVSLATLLMVFLILASVPGASAKQGSKPDKPEHPEHPEHPGHPDNPGDPEPQAPPAEPSNPVSNGVGAVDEVVSDYVAQTSQAGSEGAAMVGASTSAGYSISSSYVMSSESSQAFFFVAVTISSIVSILSLVSIFGSRPAPFITVWQLRDAVFRGGGVPAWRNVRVR